MKIDLTKANEEISVILIAHSSLRNAPLQHWQAFANTWLAKRNSFIFDDESDRKYPIVIPSIQCDIGPLQTWIDFLGRAQKMLRKRPWNIREQNRFRLTIEAVDAIITNNQKRLDEKRFLKYLG